MAIPSPVYLFKYVKHGTQNIQIDCHLWLFDSFRVHQIRFRPGLRCRPRWKSLQRCRVSLASLRGPASRVEGRERKREKERKREGRTDPLTQIPGSAPGIYLSTAAEKFDSFLRILTWMRETHSHGCDECDIDSRQGPNNKRWIGLNSYEAVSAVSYERQCAFERLRRRQWLGLIIG